jgi:hypothetical protein
MTVPFEEQYQDVLQNIEFAIVSVYRENGELSDWGVGAALDGLIRAYGAEERGRDAPVLRLAELEQKVYNRVRGMCEWRLGRQALIGDEQAGEQPDGLELPEPVTQGEIVACLKRIRLSLKRWSKQGGRRGYLDFVSQYIA